jgi:hypothetical protein
MGDRHLCFPSGIDYPRGSGTVCYTDEVEKAWGSIPHYSVFRKESDITGQEIADGVNKIIEELRENKPNGSINWGDIRCVSVKTVNYIFPDEEEEIEVEVGEASPENYICQLLIYDKFKERFGIDLYVRTEW